VLSRPIRYEVFEHELAFAPVQRAAAVVALDGAVERLAVRLGARAVAEGVAGFLRIQKADRLSGMGDFVRYRLCFRLFGRKPDPLYVEMMLHQFYH
jgi:hypothetical protein